MAEEKDTQEVENASGTEAAGESGAELTVQDLSAIKQIIDVASQRGAFRPNEMMTVGQTYSKLETFLSAVSAQQGAQGES
jgi:hypothetical protein